MNLRFLFIPGLLLAIGQGSILAQENQELGRMWTFENPPLAYLEKEYGFKPDQNWFTSLRLASLRLGGETVTKGICSASFVSPKGLIMTNNHCVRDAVNKTAGRRGPALVKSGFYATALDDELRLKTESDGWMSVSQLNKITPITDKVNAGIEEGDNSDAIKKKRKANKEKILDEAKKSDPKLVPQIVSLYQGGIFQLYQYKVYNDVRLVCMPHLQTAHFGGDPDNFTYPRYCIDFAFVRAYEDGKPADTTKHYFKWKTGGAKEGDLVFVPGNPGSTNRLNTKAQMDFDRDVKLPIQVEMLTHWLAFFRRLVDRNPTIGVQFKTMLLGWENAQKAMTGNIHGLKDVALMAQKVSAEQTFKAKVMQDPKLKANYADLWDRFEDLARRRRAHEPRSHFHSPDQSQVLATALNVVAAVDPKESSEDQEKAKKAVAEGRPDNLFTLGLFTDHLGRARNWLAKDDPYFTKFMSGATDPRRFAIALMDSKVDDPDFCTKLIEGGWNAVKESKDPGIVAARELSVLVRASDKEGEELDAEEEALGARMGLALFACYGTNVSPDATMTLRFTDGVVRGFKFNGTIAPYRTTFYGLYGRHAEFDGKHPFDMPQIWLDRKDRIDMAKAVNFVSTNDITGGNSGSVVVSKDLQVVGLIFDGNIESLHNDYVFKDDVPRSVSVHVEGIVEALKKIYDAERVVKELQGK